MSAGSQSTVTCRRELWAQSASQACANCRIWDDPCCGNQGGAADVWVFVGSMRHTKGCSTSALFHKMIVDMLQSRALSLML